MALSMRARLARGEALLPRSMLEIFCCRCRCWRFSMLVKTLQACSRSTVDVEVESSQSSSSQWCHAALGRRSIRRRWRKVLLRAASFATVLPPPQRPHTSNRKLNERA